jgi:dephospho-CoA kinase
VLLVGLTGGIGSGKSTVAGMLGKRGAVILDADVYARVAIEPGTPAYERVVGRFGPSIVDPGGEIDRAKLASVVFRDPDSLRDLEAIVHPEVRRMTADALEARSGTDEIVVVMNPLLIEMGDHERCDVLVVVTAGPETRIARLTARGMQGADARARLAVQMSIERKIALADVVVDNEGSLEELERQVDELWTVLVGRAKA